MNKFDVLMTNLQILSDLQNRVTDLLSCDEIQILEELSKFFVFLKDISISTNFGVYEGFLRLLIHLSIYYKIPKSDQEIQHMYNVFFAILKELISNHSLKTSFKISTLCFIFKYSNHFLLFLLEEGIFDFGFLQKILLKNKIPFLYFLPEIKKANPAGYIKYKKYHRLDNKFINYFYDFDIISILESMNEEQIQEEQNRNIFSDIRKETHSIEMLAKIIREDNLDSFQEFMQTHPDINLNSNIDPSIFEENPDLNNRWRGISLIEYSMAFGAINIFRYLWLNKVHFIEFSLKYSIMGGNYEIIHILEEECKYKFKKTSYSIAIQYYQNEISEYLFNYLEMTQLTFSKVLQLFNDSLNFDILFKWLCSMNSNTQENYQKTRITHYLLKYSQNAFFIFYDVLLHSNININALNTNGQTLLHEACYYSYYEIAVLLINHPQIDLNVKNSSGVKPIHVACVAGCSEIVKLLLNHPTLEIDSKNNEEFNLFHDACSLGNFEVAELFLENPNFNINFPIDCGWTQLHASCIIGDVEKCKFLLKHPNIDVNARDKYGNTPLQCACNQNHCNIIELLLKHPNIKVNTRDKEGQTPLYKACSNNHYCAVDLLLKHSDIDINIRGPDRCTPYEIARFNNYTEIINLFKKLSD